MIRITAVTKQKEVLQQISLAELQQHDIDWYWVDISEPNEEEAAILKDYFQFHPLAIEDCLEYEQRPKIDFYDEYWFLILNHLNKKNYKSEEINIFMCDHFLVSFHYKPIAEIEKIVTNFPEKLQYYRRPIHLLHRIVDELVDQFFPPLYDIEDRLSELDKRMTYKSLKQGMEELYRTRGDVSKLRKTILPMRDLVYRLLYTDNHGMAKENKHYFKDIYDHLVQLATMIENSRELIADIRDNYYSLSNDHMNSIMKTLTIISSFFLPLTFIVGVYGMNFLLMPELGWKFGYLFVWVIMIGITVWMYHFFKKKGWFD